MAVMYYAACIHTMMSADEDAAYDEYDTSPDYDNFSLTEEENETYCEEQWRECWNRIPVLQASDLENYFQNSNENIFFSGFPMQQSNRGMNCRPYWMDCTKEAVCILNNDSGFGGFGMPTEQSLIEILRYFEHNRIVFLLMVQPNSSRYEYFDDELDGGIAPMGHGDMLRNNIVLSFMADEARVFLPEEKEKTF